MPENWGSFFDQAPTDQSQVPVAAMRAQVRGAQSGPFGGKGIFPTSSTAGRMPSVGIQPTMQQPKPDLSFGLPTTPPKIATNNEMGDDAKAVAGLVKQVTGQTDKPAGNSFDGAMATIGQQLAQMRAERKQALGALNSGQSKGEQTNPNTPSYGGTLPPGSVDGNFGRMLQQESGSTHFRNGAPITSPAGAIGIAQIMPGTAPIAAKLAGLPWDPELFNRKQTGDPVKDAEARDYNLALGKAYYEDQVKTFGDPNLASAAYNAGPGAVHKALEQAKATGRPYIDFLPAETQHYVSVVAGPAAEKKVAEAETGYDAGGRVRWLRSMVGG